MLLFLDADMVATRQHVEAHARWHHVIADAVVVGRKYFVDFDGITPDEISRAVRHDRMDALLHGRPRQRHSWLEDFVKGSKHLTDWAAERSLLLSVLASLPLARYTRNPEGSPPWAYEASSTLDSGTGSSPRVGLWWPKWSSSPSIKGPATSPAGRRDQAGASRSGRKLSARATLSAGQHGKSLGRAQREGHRGGGHGPDEDVLFTVDSVLRPHSQILPWSSRRYGSATARWLIDYFAHDHRVTFADDPVKSGFPSPFTAVVPAGAALSRTTLAQLIRRIRTGRSASFEQPSPGFLDQVSSCGRPEPFIGRAGTSDMKPSSGWLSGCSASFG